MRVLLINSNRYHHPWPVMPFGLGCVAAAVEQAGHTVAFLDLCFCKNAGAEIKNRIDEFVPDVVGIGIRNLDTCVGTKSQMVIEDIHRDIIGPLKIHYKGLIVLGGSALGISAAEILACLDLEFAIQGDGETAFVTFLEHLAHQKPLQNCPGLIPLAPLLVTWDTLISVFRCYNANELLAMAKDLGSTDYHWEAGCDWHFVMPVTYLIGYPLAASG